MLAGWMALILIVLTLLADIYVNSVQDQECGVVQSERVYPVIGALYFSHFLQFIPFRITQKQGNKS
jgi:hypothetical protein